MPSELEIESDRLAEFLDRNRLDGVLLEERRNFAWNPTVTGTRSEDTIPSTESRVLGTRCGAGLPWPP